MTQGQSKTGLGHSLGSPLPQICLQNQLFFNDFSKLVLRPNGVLWNPPRLLLDLKGPPGRPKGPQRPPQRSPLNPLGGPWDTLEVPGGSLGGPLGALDGAGGLLGKPLGVLGSPKTPEMPPTHSKHA